MPERIIHETTARVLADRIAWARSFRTRARGLIRRDLAVGAALILEPTSQIHTFGMTYEIDVLFCRSDWSVMYVIRNLRPNRVTRWVRACRRVVELPGGSVPPQVAVGDRLLVS